MGADSGFIRAIAPKREVVRAFSHRLMPPNFTLTFGNTEKLGHTRKPLKPKFKALG